MLLRWCLYTACLAVIANAQGGHRHNPRQRRPSNTISQAEYEYPAAYGGGSSYSYNGGGATYGVGGGGFKTSGGFIKGFKTQGIGSVRKNGYIYETRQEPATYDYQDYSAGDYSNGLYKTGNYGRKKGHWDYGYAEDPGYKYVKEYNKPKKIKKKHWVTDGNGWQRGYNIKKGWTKNKRKKVKVKGKTVTTKRKLTTQAPRRTVAPRPPPTPAPQPRQELRAQVQVLMVHPWVESRMEGQVRYYVQEKFYHGGTQWDWAPAPQHFQTYLASLGHWGGGRGAQAAWQGRAGRGGWGGGYAGRWTPGSQWQWRRNLPATEAQFLRSYVGVMPPSQSGQTAFYVRTPVGGVQDVQNIGWRSSNVNANNNDGWIAASGWSSWNPGEGGSVSGNWRQGTGEHLHPQLQHLMRRSQEIEYKYKQKT